MKKNDLKVLIVCISLLLTSSVFGITIESKKQEMQLDKNKGFFEGDVKVQIGDVVVQSPRADLDLVITYCNYYIQHQTIGGLMPPQDKVYYVLKTIDIVEEIPWLFN